MDNIKKIFLVFLFLSQAFIFNKVMANPVLGNNSTYPIYYNIENGKNLPVPSSGNPITIVDSISYTLTDDAGEVVCEFNTASNGNVSGMLNEPNKYGVQCLNLAYGVEVVSGPLYMACASGDYDDQNEHWDIGVACAYGYSTSDAAKEAAITSCKALNSVHPLNCDQSAAVQMLDKTAVDAAAGIYYTGSSDHYNAKTNSTDNGDDESALNSENSYYSSHDYQNRLIIEVEENGNAPCTSHYGGSGGKKFKNNLIHQTKAGDEFMSHIKTLYSPNDN